MGTPVGISPMRASSFLSTLGVVTHIPYTDGGYVNLGNVVADLHYLGITQVRDSLSDGSNGSAPLSSDIYLAQQGIKFTTIVETSTTAGLNYALSLIDQVNAAVPGSITAVEGPNEINNFPLTFNGVSGLQGAINLQKALYADVHSDPNLTGVPVDYFTGYDAGSIATGPNPYTTAGLADYDTQHPYPTYGQAPAWFVSPSNSLPNEGPVYGPAVYTETGYSTNGGSSGGLAPVNQDVQAKYTIDLLMDAAKDGISKTYLYQLMDAYQPGSPQGDDGFGLFDPNNAPKEAATAIHNLTTILADNGAGSNTFATTPLNYSVTGLPPTGNSMLMEKSNGAYDIVVWNEPQIWNESTGTEITAPTVNVTVQLGKTYSEVEVFDPLVGSTPIQTLTQISSAQLGITDHPLIVEIEPAPIVTAQTADQTWTGGQAINFALASNTFSDPEQEAVTYAAALSNGAPFPSWLAFNAATETFSGTAPNSPANFNVNVTATNTSGLSTTEHFSITIAAPVGPDVTVVNVTLSQASVAASSLFTASDPGGHTITEYGVEDTGSGHFVLNGVAQPDNQEIDITAAQLSQLTHQSVLGTTDTLEIRAEDQIGWGNWASFVATAPPRVIQTDSSAYGTTSLTELASEYFLYSVGGRSGPELKYNGLNVTAGEFGGWVPIGAVQTSTGYDVAWEIPGTNQYSAFTTDSSGNYLSNIFGAVPGNSPALESLEPTFNQDLNGDGVIGLPTIVIRTDPNAYGSTSLVEIGNNYFLEGSGGSGPELKYNGLNVTAGEFGGWVPIGAVQTSTGYDVAWEIPGTNQYSAFTTDSSGNYLSNIFGAVPGNSPALESLEPTFNQDLNGDGVIGLPTIAIRTDTTAYGSTSLVEIGNNYFLEGSGRSGPELKYNGLNVTAGEFGGWVPIGAVQTSTGYDVAWEIPETNQYSAFTTDSSGNYLSNIFGAVPGNSPALESLEPTFNQDLNGDGAIGLPTIAIRTDTTAYGSTSLVEIGNNYFLEGSGGSGPELKYNGLNVTAGEFGGWVPIGAVQTSTGYDVAWEIPGTNQYSAFTTDSSGNYLSNIFGAVPGNSPALESLEPTFNQDLNGDGVIGLPTIVIRTDPNAYGSTSLVEIGNNYFLEGSGGSGPELKYNGLNVTAGEFGGWVPIGAVQTSTGYDVAWEIPGTNQYSAFTTDSSGNYLSNIFGAVPGNSPALESLEPTFNQDLNGDGVIGLPTIVIRTDPNAYGSTSLVEIGNNYFLEGSGRSGPELKYNGLNVTAGEFGGWVPIGAVQTSTGYDVAWEIPGTNQYSAFTTDSSGNYLSNIFGAVPGNSPALESLEPTFNQDINGDGVIGFYAVPGTTLQVSQSLAAASAAASIGAGASLELAAAYSGSVTFNASTGMLKLDNPSTFTGEIFNFTGNGNLSGSDQIDLRTISYNAVRDSYAAGVLTVTDGSNSATLDFNGSYTLANFRFANDGNGGTIVYDPPVLNSPTAGTRIVTADHSNDAFSFHTNLSQTASTEHTFGTDTVPVDKAEFAWASLAIVHDAHENTIFPDALHDMHNNALAQQHHSGFLI